MLRLVEAFVSELGGPRTVGADDLLDHDLGVGSLERVELLLRLEHAFAMRFPDVVLGEARAPRDLIDAVMAGTPALPERHAPLPAGVAAPAVSRTLVDVLRWHADTAPDRLHIFLHADGDQMDTTMTSRARRKNTASQARQRHVSESGPTRLASTCSISLPDSRDTDHPS